MPKRSHHGSIRPVLVSLLLLLTIGGVFIYRRNKQALPRFVLPPPIASVAATKPPPRAVSKPHAKPSAAEAYLRVVRAAYPDVPATQPLGIPLEISQAAHLILQGQIYLAATPRKEMWLTRADAPSTDLALKQAVDETLDVDVHVVRDRVAFVHWMPTSSGIWPPYLVCATDNGGFEVVSTAYGRQPLPNRRNYYWEHAISWNEKVVVPAEHG